MALGKGLGLPFNRIGGNGAYVPFRDDAVQLLDKTFQDSDEVWKQKDLIGRRDGEVFLGSFIDMNGTDNTLVFDDLTSVTIVDYSGTTTLAISTNTITATAGTLINLELSNGAKFYFEEQSGIDCFDHSGLGFNCFIGGTYTDANRGTDIRIPCMRNNYGYNDGGVSQIELIANGDFSSDTDWTTTDNAYIEDGVGVCGAYITEPSRIKQVILTSGKQYKVEFDIVEYTDGDIKDFRAILHSINISGSLTTTGHYSFIGTSTGTTLQFYNNSQSSSVKIDNVSVKEYYPEEVKIPADLSNPRYDVIGNVLENYGQVRYPATCKSSVLYSNGTNNKVETGITVELASSTFEYKGVVVDATVSDLLGTDGIGGNHLLYMIYKGFVRINIWNNSGSWFYMDGTTVISDGDIIDLKIVHDYDNKTIKAYLNDALETTITYTGEYTPTSLTYKLFSRGNIYGNFTSFYASLTSSTAENSFEYLFSEFGGTTIYNSVENGVHGTLNGTIDSDTWKLSEYQCPYNNTKGCDVWQNDSDSSYIYIRLRDDGMSIKGSGDTITGYTWVKKLPGTTRGHNGCEMVYNQPECYDLYQVDQQFTAKPWYLSGVPIDVDYDTISYNYELANLWFADVLSKSPVKYKWLVYATAKDDPEDLAKVLRYERSNEPLFDEDGSVIIDSNGNVVYALKEGLE